MAAKTQSNWLRTIAAVFGGGAAALAAAATLIDNSETVGKFVAERLYPFVQTTTTFAVALDAKAPSVLFVAVADIDNPNRPLDVQGLPPGGSVTFEVPIKTYYALSWEGAGYKAAAIDRIQAPPVPRRWTLSPSDTDEDGLTLKPKEEGASTEIETVPVPAATLIAGAAAADQADRSAPAGGAQLMPELYRALSTIGLFEVGTTDCVTRSYAHDFGFGVGCLGVAIPGPLTGMLKAIDARQPALLDKFFGAEAVFIRGLLAMDVSGQMAALRELRGQKERQRLLRDGLAGLAATLDFRAEYQLVAEGYYARALQRAKELQLSSERGVLFAFDRDIQQGGNWFRKVAADYAAQEAAIAPGDDRKRLELLGALVKAALPSALNAGQVVGRRIDTIVTGQGTFRGIAFDLDSIGIRYDNAVVVDTAGIAVQPAAAAPSDGCAGDRSTAQIETCVRNILVEHLGVDPARISDDASLIDDLGADELDVVEVAMALDEAFGIEISDEQAARFVTVKDIVDFIAASPAP